MRPSAALACAAFAALAYFCAASCPSSLPTEVVILTDTSFEHATQSSTGQTTGIWCILFTSRSDMHHANAHAMWEMLAADEDKEVIYAEVDVSVNKKLAKRFNQIQPLPKAVLLRDRMMYTYAVPLHTTDGHEMIMGFTAEGYTLMQPEKVPAPGTSVEEVTDANVRKLYIAYAVMAMAIVWKICLFLQKPQGAAAQPPRQLQQQNKEPATAGSGSSKQASKRNGSAAASAAKDAKDEKETEAEAPAAKGSKQPDKAGAAAAAQEVGKKAGAAAAAEALDKKAQQSDGGKKGDKKKK